MHNFFEYLIGLVVLYLFSVAVISFLSGFYLQTVEAFAWQGFIGGFMIGFIVPTVILPLGREINPLILGTICGLIGLAGYFVSRRKYRSVIA